ncbi:MAG TPA: hypothetical protein VEJ84_08610 [Acidimicrobiales bacterium]|nr:hypothetical protein [Acidimicrobiales bacterium]
MATDNAFHARRVASAERQHSSAARPGPRSLQERVSDFLWGTPEPSPEEHRYLEAVRASVRTQAREAETIYLAELDRVGAGRGVMAAPPRAERQKFGQAKGEYRRAHSGEWDWFEGLSRHEQERLRRSGWFAEPGRGESPDEIAERIPIREWLQLTRNVDMTRAMATGHHTNPKRYGGQDPRSLIVGEPYDFGELHHESAGRGARHLVRARESGRLGLGGGGRCQFRTRPDGTVYPLANTCNPREPAVGYRLNAYGERVTVGSRDYGDDKAF